MTAKPRLRSGAAGVIVACIAAVALAADQFTKHLALTNLTENVPVPILGPVLNFRLVFNPGAAFSLGENVTWVFTIALAAVAVAALYIAFRRVHSKLWVVVLGCLLGGVLGNLADRLFRAPGFPVGHVVDFINTPWLIPAIYNVADIFIVTSMIALALLVLIGIEFDGSRVRDEEKSEKVVLKTELVLGEESEADRYESRADRRKRLEREAAEVSAGSEH